MHKKLIGAMAAYAALIVIAFRVLHGNALYAILILFGALIAKTLVSIKRDRVMFQPETSSSDMDSTSNQESSVFPLPASQVPDK
jgi:hypothetical protein